MLGADAGDVAARRHAKELLKAALSRAWRRPGALAGTVVRMAGTTTAGRCGSTADW